MTQQPFIAETTFYIRYAETDAMGIVHHASYIVWFEEARSAYTRQRGHSYAEMEQEGYFMAVTDVQARYRKAMRYGQRVIVRCWITEFRSRALTFDYEILDADTEDLCVTGQTRHMCLDTEGRPVKFPDSWGNWR